MEHLSPERSAWVEIDLSSLRNNFDLIRHIVGPHTAIMPVVKADAYGHGAPQVARVLAEAGAAAFAVVTVEELRQLRQAGISLPILTLSYVPPRAYPALLELGGMATVYSMEQARELSQVAEALGCTARIHVKVDTGLTRLGFEATEQSADQIVSLSRLPHMEVNGLFSHFADSDDPDKTYSLRQLTIFNDFVTELENRGLDIPWKHISNSAAIANIPEARWNMVRPGILLHGCYGSVDVPRIAGVRPVMAVKAEIVRLRDLPKGGCVSYNCTWQAGRLSRIATLPLGYADGVPRLLANRGEALIAGRRAPIVGRVCMDHFMVDVTDIASETPVNSGDEAVFIGYQGHEHITADEIANMTGTINYEIFCHLGLRLPRIYLEVKAMETVAIGCDHAGFEAKELVKKFLDQRGVPYQDFGCHSTESVHYPFYGQAVAQAVASGVYPRGILICGTGIGMSIVANKVKGIRAALCHNAFTAQASREHNNANILCMGARVLTQEQMEEIVELWLTTPFAGGRHQLRLDMIE